MSEHMSPDFLPMVQLYILDPERSPDRKAQGEKEMPTSALQEIILILSQRRLLLRHYTQLLRSQQISTP